MGELGTHRKVAVALGVAATVAASLVTTSVGAGAATTKSTSAKSSAADIKVGSFNVRSVKNDLHRAANEQPWKQRRAVVVSQIVQENLDVVGVQEVSQNPKYGSHLASNAPNQYMDLLNGLNEGGRNWAITNTDPSTSRTTRIFYNKDTVSMVRSGTYRYERQSSGVNDARYVVWAVFEDRASGTDFLFTNTHLATGATDLQQAQWREMLNKINEIRGNLPVVTVGDFQRSKMKDPTASMMTAMKDAGVGDVVGQQPMDIFLKSPRPQSLSQQWVNSFNGFDRKVVNWSYEKNSAAKAGNNNDWIFASNNLTVLSWEVVANIDWGTWKLRGVIPSDHNLVVAGIRLPAAS